MSAARLPDLSDPGRRGGTPRGRRAVQCGVVRCVPMERRTIELRIAGQKYRVVSSASEEELSHIAELLGAKLAELGGRSRGEPSQAMLLAALALAHDVMVERDRRASLEDRTRALLGRTMARIDEALRAGQTIRDGTVRGGAARPRVTCPPCRVRGTLEWL